MIEKENSDKTIRVEIIESKPNGFYIQDLEKIESKKITTKDLEYSINVVTSTNTEDKLLKIELELDAFLIKSDEDENSSIFGIKSTTIFRTPDFNKVVGKNKKIIGPDDFIKKLLNICIGGIRGMLSVNLINTELNHVTLPLLDLGRMQEQEISE